MFAWEAYDKGSEVHLQADPTKLQLLHQSFKVKKEDFKDKQKETILAKVCPPATKMAKSLSCCSPTPLIYHHGCMDRNEARLM